jgi:O-antigen ligase
VTAIFYLLVYTGGLLAALSGRPLYGLYVYFFAFYFHANTQWWGAGLPNLRWSLIAAFITMVVLFLKQPEGGLRFWRYTENKLLTFYTLFVVLQTSWVDNQALHIDYVILLVKFMILIFLIQNIVHSEKEMKGIIWVNVLGAAFLAYYGMTQNNGGRMENLGPGSGWDSNLVGMHFAAILVLGGYLLLEKFHRKQIILMVGMAFVMIGLFMTESRGALIALGATGLIAIIFRPQTQKKKFISFGLLAILAGAALTGPQIIDRFVGMKKDNIGDVSDRSAESRMVIINAQIEMWKDSPWVGHGHRGTLVMSPEYIPAVYLTSSGGNSVRASHNITMAILVDHGIIGFALYFGAVIIAMLKIFRYKYPYPEAELTSEQRVFSHIQIAAILALICFMIAGQGANNKKLEADIWLLALIPLIAGRIQEEKRILSEKLSTLDDEGYPNGDIDRHEYQ